MILNMFEELERVAAAHLGNKDVQDLVETVRSLQRVLSDTQGSLHVINYHARHIRLWLSDPNVDVAGSCAAIEKYRGEAHDRISKVIFPFKEEEAAAKRLMGERVR